MSSSPLARPAPGLVRPASAPRPVLCNSWPKAGTHALLELARLALGDGPWYGDPDIKYPEGEHIFVARATESLARHAGGACVIKGHFGRGPLIESFLAEHDFAHLFAVRDPREVVCSTWRWLRDLRRHWAISRHLAPLSPDEQISAIIRGLPVLAPFDADRDVRWDLPLPGRYAALTRWLDSPDCCVLAYEDLAGMRGASAQFSAVERALGHMRLPFDRADVVRVAGLVCNPASATFHSGPASHWEKHFTAEHRRLFVELGGEELVERLGYEPTLPRRPRPLARARGAAAPEAEAESDAGPDLRAFVDQLARFFGAAAPVQVEFASASGALVVAHHAGSPLAIQESVETSPDFPRLPLADGAAPALFNLGTIASLDDRALDAWLPELRRVARGPAWIALESSPGRDRAWWENRFIEAGFRKHPLAQTLVPFEALEDESQGLLLVLEAIPPAVLARRPLAALRAERDLHMDMLREPGLRSDAHLARYVLARELIPARARVLDAACGLGYGAAALARDSSAAAVIGVDLCASSVAYAREVYEPLSPVLQFHAHDATRLPWIGDGTIDLVVSFETLEHVPNPERLLREFARVLKPGGLLIASVPNLWIDEQGRNPVPYHLHVYDHEQFHGQIARHLEWRALYRQNAGGGWKRPQPRSLRLVPDGAPTDEDLRDAEWWIAVARKAA